MMNRVLMLIFLAGLLASESVFADPPKLVGNIVACMRAQSCRNVFFFKSEPGAAVPRIAMEWSDTTWRYRFILEEAARSEPVLFISVLHRRRETESDLLDECFADFKADGEVDFGENCGLVGHPLNRASYHSAQKDEWHMTRRHYWQQRFDAIIEKAKTRLF